MSIKLARIVLEVNIWIIGGEITTNIDDPPIERERKFWYEITLIDGKKVGNFGDIHGYYETFESYIDQNTSYVTIKNDYYGSKQKYKQDALNFHTDRNPYGDHILFLKAKSKWDRIQQAYCILGDTNEDGHN